MKKQIKRTLYRVNEFCEIYAISRTAFYREVKAGRLSILKRGSRTFVSEDSAKLWLKSLGHHVDVPVTHKQTIPAKTQVPHRKRREKVKVKPLPKSSVPKKKSSFLRGFFKTFFRKRN